MSTIDKIKLFESQGRNGYTVNELKKFCRENTLKISGTKKQLIDRIIEYININQSSFSLSSLSSSSSLSSLSSSSSSSSSPLSSSIIKIRINNNSLAEWNEEQKHGFEYEKYFCEKTGAILSNNYRDKFDAYLNNIPIQIKYMKENTEICMGDFFRQSQIDTDFILHIASWKNNINNQKELCSNSLTFFIEAKKWKSEFDFFPPILMEEMKTEFSLITNLVVDDDRFHEYTKKYHKYFEGKFIQLRFKRDHKSQKRIQCAIPNKNITILKNNYSQYDIFTEGEKHSRELDKFYTKPTIADYICQLIQKEKLLEKIEFVLEPSAGNGVFINSIKKLGIFKPPIILSYDLEPAHPDIIIGNFLTEEVKKDIYEKTKNKEIICIGNPPFGKQNSLAVKFFNQITSIDNINNIILILPRSFGKISIQDRLDERFGLYLTELIDENSFTLNGNDYKVPTCVQWWKRGLKRENNNKNINPIGFKYVKIEELSDIEIVRVGGKAGFGYLSENGPKAKYNYFLLLDDKSKRHVFLENLNKLDLTEYTKNTTGPKSISKREITPILNKFLI